MTVPANTGFSRFHAIVAATPRNAFGPPVIDTQFEAISSASQGDTAPTRKRKRGQDGANLDAVAIQPTRVETRAGRVCSPISPANLSPMSPQLTRVIAPQMLRRLPTASGLTAPTFPAGA